MESRPARLDTPNWKNGLRRRVALQQVLEGAAAVPKIDLRRGRADLAFDHAESLRILRDRNRVQLSGRTQSTAFPCPPIRPRGSFFDFAVGLSARRFDPEGGLARVRMGGRPCCRIGGMLVLGKGHEAGSTDCPVGIKCHTPPWRYLPKNPFDCVPPGLSAGRSFTSNFRTERFLTWTSRWIWTGWRDHWSMG